MTFAVDWALSNNYLSIYLCPCVHVPMYPSCFLVVEISFGLAVEPFATKLGMLVHKLPEWHADCSGLLNVHGMLIFLFLFFLFFFSASGQAFCGNQITEGNEQCDCGFVSGDTCPNSTCCEPRDEDVLGSGCKLKPGVQCRY